MALSVADVIEQLDTSLGGGSGDEDKSESTQEPDLEAQMPMSKFDEFEASPDLDSVGSVDLENSESDEANPDSDSDELEYSESNESLNDSPSVDEPSSSRQTEDLLSEPSYDSQREQCSDDDSCNEELPRKRGTRKRLRRPDKWKRNKRQRRRNSGQRYISTAKKLVRNKQDYVIIFCLPVLGSPKTSVK